MIATLAMLPQVETAFREPVYFAPVMLSMLALGAFDWLIAAVLGFARAKAFGPSARWFSFAAVSLILFHLQFIALGFGLLTKDNSFVFGTADLLQYFCDHRGGVRDHGFYSD